MRRRSAGARAGNALAARGQLAGSAWAAQRFGSGRARISREKRVLQFAVCSCNAAHAVTQLAHPRTTSAGQSVAAAAPILVGLAGTHSAAALLARY